MCEPLVSEPGFALPNKVVAVAVDRDENSKYAVKWAVSYLFPNKNKHNHASLILVHVKKRRNQAGDMNGTSPVGRGESCDDVDTSDLFKAFRAYSSRKGAKDIKEWELHEAHRLAHARLVREAAFALVKKERAKGEAAVKAQKVATMEAERRKYAELKIKKEAEAKNRALNVLSNNNVSYRKYTVEEIEVATDYFSDSLKIGEGGYGPVYEGKLDRTRVAIKVHRSGDAKRRKQFQQEVEVLSRMRHPNMVLLIGACPQYGCLVYEYMNNGSLEDRLFRKGNTRPMSWRIRFKVAASCYIDPEYQQTGKLDVKSDIYSFGIILLQILTASPLMGLIHKVEKSIIEGTFADLLDPAVSRWPIEEALTLAKIALQCVELKKKDRPDLCSVVLPELNRLKEFGGIIN